MGCKGSKQLCHCLLKGGNGIVPFKPLRRRLHWRTSWSRTAHRRRRTSLVRRTFDTTRTSITAGSKVVASIYPQVITHVAVAAVGILFILAISITQLRSFSWSRPAWQRPDLACEALESECLLLPLATGLARAVESAKASVDGTLVGFGAELVGCWARRRGPRLCRVVSISVK